MPGVSLIAVLVAVTADEPRVLTVSDAQALPAGPFAVTDRSLQASLRAWTVALASKSTEASFARSRM